MNKVQIEEYLKNIYGKNIDAHTYLQKFVSIEVNLPKQIRERNTNDIRKYAIKLLELHEMRAYGDDVNTLDSIECLAIHFNLSLRQLEKAFSNLAIFYATISNDDYRNAPIMTFLSVVKVIDTSLFESLLHGKSKYTDVTQKLSLQNLDDDNWSSRNLSNLMQWVRLGLLSDKEFSELPELDHLRTLDKSLSRYAFSREELFPYFLQKLNMFTV